MGGTKVSSSGRFAAALQKVSSLVSPVVAEAALADPGSAVAASSSLETELLLHAHPESNAAALERRLRRLAFDLHDGALQELAALGAELASMRRQVVPLVGEEVQDRVDGRFDDVQARLAAVDQTLRALMAT